MKFLCHRWQFKGTLVLSGILVFCSCISSVPPTRHVSTRPQELPVAEGRQEIESDQVTHTVKPNETLWRISKHYGVSVEQLAFANNLTNSGQITVGQQLLIPSGSGQPTPPDEPTIHSSADQATFAQDQEEENDSQEEETARPSNNRSLLLAAMLPAIPAANLPEIKTAPSPATNKHATPPAALPSAAPSTTSPSRLSPAAPSASTSTISAASSSSSSSSSASPSSSRSSSSSSSPSRSPSSSLPSTSSSPRASSRSDAVLVWPLKGVLYARFGMRGESRHDGIDIAAPEGTIIRSAADGEVLYSGQQKGYGNLVIIQHADGLITLYAHNKENLVDERARVKANDPVARVGVASNTSGPHLHFEVRVKSMPVDPINYLPRLK